MVFGLNEKWDDYFYSKFIVIYLIAFFINVFSNGQATLFFIEEEYSYYFEEGFEGVNLSDFEVNYYTSLEDKSDYYVRKYHENVGYKNDKIVYINLFLYFVFLPLIDFYYFFALKGVPKSI